MNGYKYEPEFNVTAKRDLTTFLTDEETGEEYEKFIPEGSKGTCHSCGRSSVCGFVPMYDVTFYLDGDEPDITFLEPDLELELNIEPNEHAQAEGR